MTQAPPPPGEFPAPPTGGYPPQPAGGYQAAPPPAAGYGYGNVPGAAGPIGKLRSPAAVIIFSIITFGIYHLVWTFKTSNEIKNHSGLGVGGGIQLILALFVGFVPPFLMANDTGAMRKNAGQEPKVSAVTGLWIILPLIGYIVWVVKVQGALNEYWTSRGAVKA